MFLPPRGLRKCRKVWDDHENGKQLFVCRSMQILLHNNQLFNWHRNRTVDAARQPGLIAQIKQDAFVPGKPPLGSKLWKEAVLADGTCEVYPARVCCCCCSLIDVDNS